MTKATCIRQRASQLFHHQRDRIQVRTDGLFAKLFVLQYFAAIYAALAISPKTWMGSESSVHVHVYAAVILGALIFSFPLYLIKKMPGAVLTRHTVAIAQMLFSGLLIHLTGGRIETHFHIFGSLAFLSFYRDWRVLASASAIVAADHFLRGVFWPQSVFGVLTADGWRWLEHAGWVLFEDIFLYFAISQSLQEMQGIAEHQAKTEFKEASLRKSEADFRAIFQLAGSGKLEADPVSARITKVNKKYCEITGYSEDELLGMRIFDLTWPEDLAQDRARYANLHVGAAPDFHYEKRYRRKDGSCMWVSVTGAVIKDENGIPIRTIATIHDITEKRRIEEELAVSRIKAEEASHAKSAFIANMSHEIRTPLGAMLGFAQLMLDDQNTTVDQQNNLKTILRNGDQLYRIINEVLDISKIEANKMDIEKARFSLDEVIYDVTSLLSVKAQQKGLALEVHSAGPLPDTIVTDQTKFRQILVNVIGNAIKFTDQGKVEVTFRLKESEADSSCLEIRVEDTGTGIPEEKRDRLFKPFSQADATTSRKFGGTGLGLYLSRTFAQALGGDLRLEPASEAAGTTFLITIDAGPLERKPFKHLHAGMGEHVVKGDFTQAKLERLDGVRVLVVDDSPDNLRLTTRMLTASGADVECAADGESAIKVLASLSFDVVLMDIQMPGLDGYETIRRLRAMGYRKPVLALTAHAMKGERERCLEAGFDGHLVKPIDRPAMLKAVRERAKPVFEPVREQATV